MDNIYQAIKAFFKAIINLFVAVIDLFAGLLNGIAFLFEKLKPKAAERLNSLGTEKEGAAAKQSSKGKRSDYGNRDQRAACSAGEDKRAVLL